MVVSIIDHGRMNVVDLDPDHLARGEGVVELSGSGNVVRIAKPTVYGDIRISVAGGAHVVFEKDCSLSRIWVNSPLGARLTVGANTWFNGNVAFHMQEERGIKVGCGCLIADEVRVWASDMHSIVSTETGKRLNPPRDVIIEDRVFIGFRALVLKGSKIGSGSILAAGSVLAAAVPSNCVAAGNPARIIKSGVTWDARLLAS